MKKTFLEEVEALYLKKLAKLNERKQKSMAAYDWSVCGIDFKTQRIEDQIEELNKQYRPIKSASALLAENQKLLKEKRRIEFMCNDLRRLAAQYDPHEVELIEKRWR